MKFSYLFTSLLFSLRNRSSGGDKKGDEDFLIVKKRNHVLNDEMKTCFVEGKATCAFGGRRMFHMHQPKVTLWKRPRRLDRVSPLQWRPLNALRSFCCIPGSPLDRELIVCASTHPLSLIITCPRISRNDLPKVSQSYSVLVYVQDTSNTVENFSLI